MRGSVLEYVDHVYLARYAMLCYAVLCYIMFYHCAHTHTPYLPYPATALWQPPPLLRTHHIQHLPMDGQSQHHSNIATRVVSSLVSFLALAWLSARHKNCCLRLSPEAYVSQ